MTKPKSIEDEVRDLLATNMYYDHKTDTYPQAKAITALIRRNVVAELKDVAEDMDCTCDSFYYEAGGFKDCIHKHIAQLTKERDDG